MKRIEAAVSLSMLSFVYSCGKAPGDDFGGMEPATRSFALRYLEEEEARFLEIINEHRASQDPPIGSLTSSATINQAAYDYSLLMAETGWFDHEGPDGSTPWDRMCDAGYVPACGEGGVYGENIAYGASTAREVFEMWRSSPGHNANMLSPDYAAIGIGLAIVVGGRLPYVWTTDFSSFLDLDGCACREGDARECESEVCGPGMETCLGLCQWSECGPPNPGADVCDGYDNNCNGEIDEGDVCHGCTPVIEVCDDEDNDCDDLVDEENVCGSDCEPMEEVCDANDNDCDGTVDEGCLCPVESPDRICGYSEGACRTGIQQCSGVTWSDCEGAIPPRLEICDGYDNDCDGAIDERACGAAGDGDGGGGGSGGCSMEGCAGGGPWGLIALIAAMELALALRRRRVILFSPVALIFLAGCMKSTPPPPHYDDGGDRGDAMETGEAIEDPGEDVFPGEPLDEAVEAAADAPDAADTAGEDPFQEEAAPTDLPFGASCSADGECASGLCLPGHLGGTCSEECHDEDSCAYAHIGYSCTPFGRDMNGNGLTDSVVTACVRKPPGSLETGSRCVNPLECSTRICIEGGICMNVCANSSDCTPASECLPHSFPLEEGSGEYMACGFEAVSSVMLEEYDYGTLTLVTESTGGRRRDIFVPPDSVSLTITGIQTAPAQSALVGYLEVLDPSNAVIYDMVDFYDGLDPPNWHVPWIRMGIFMVPITPRVMMMGGAYRFHPVTARFSETEPTITVTTDFSFQVKRAPFGTVSSGAIDMNFFFVGLDSLGAAAAQVPDSEFQRVLGWVNFIYDAAGLALGSKIYIDIGEPDRSTYRILHLDENDPNLGELMGLLSLSAGRTEHAVNVFLVHDIDEWGVLGISPGIPGPQGIHGTGASGVVVNYDSTWNEMSAGMVIAHEVGHYLGLFHSTESEARPYPGDPIDDTAYGDTSNLMHWQWGGSQLTPGQGFVLLRAALVH